MQIVTINDIAREAGVSMATVSRVINGSEVVTEPKRQRVLRAMRELNYVPVSRNGRSAPGSRIILLISSILSIPVDLSRGLSSALKDLDAGYELVIKFVGDHDYGGALSLLKMLPPGMVRGLIFYNNVCEDGALWDEFQRYPLVQIGEYKEAAPAYVVTVDNAGAMAEMTRLLIRKGRRRFVLVSNNFSPEQRKYNFCIFREAGFHRALREEAVPFDESRVLYMDYTVEGGIDAAGRIAELRPRPDAVVCISDCIALGCVTGLRERGIAVPGEIAVTGFDGFELSEISIPCLTTVRQPFEEMGIEAARMLDALGSGNLSLGRITLIPYSIIERGSS